MPTTVNWMWIGNRADQFNSDPDHRISQGDAEQAIGWDATGRAEIKPVQVEGPSIDPSWKPSHFPFPTNFNYTQPGTGIEVTAQVTTFINADFVVRTEDADGNLIDVVKKGVLMQTSNGDVFFRPDLDSVDDWNDINIIYGITVQSIARLPATERIAKIGFNAEILDVEIPTCFVAGTLIRTVSGEVAIEDLKVGDLVWTADHGPQPLRWVGGSKVSAAVLRALPNLRPIRIRAGALGAGQPVSDLLVSPQHRVLVRSQIAQRMFGAPEVLVAAKHLLALDGIEVAEDCTEVTYYHILFDRHAVVQSNGAQTESLYTGPQALKSISAAARDEILLLFPELGQMDYRPEPARPLTKGREGRKLAERHAQNGHALSA